MYDRDCALGVLRWSVTGAGLDCHDGSLAPALAGGESLDSHGDIGVAGLDGGLTGSAAEDVVFSLRSGAAHRVVNG